MSNDVDTQGWVPATYLEPLDGGWCYYQRCCCEHLTVHVCLVTCADPEGEEQHSQAVPAAGELGDCARLLSSDSALSTGKGLCLTTRLLVDEKYITTASYHANGSDEIGFDKGVVVRVLEKKLDGWWRVEYQSKQGWAPGTYLQLL